MANIFTKVADKLKSAAHAVAHVFVAIFGAQASADFAKSAEEILATDFGKVVQSIVAGLVSVAEAQGGAAARSQAFDAIKSQAVSSGLDLKDSLINLLIELAVTKLKGTLAALSAASL